MKKALIVTGVVLGLGGIVAASILTGDREKRTKVHAAEVAARDLTHVVKSSGRINPRVKVNISAHVVGKIEVLHVDEGDEIAAGAPFLELEKEAFVAVERNARAQLAIERSRLRQAEIDLADGELKLGRARRLSESGISSAEQVEAAEIQLERARLEKSRAEEAILQARAALEKATDDLEKTTIYSPLAGRVIRLDAEEGEVVVSGTMNMPGSVIGVVADLSEILAEVDVDETEIVEVRPGQVARVYVDALPDEVYEGVVSEIGSSGTERAKQPDVTFFEVEVLLEDPDARLRPGMSARAEIEIATHRDALTVPIEAVVQREPLGDVGSSADGEAGAEGRDTVASREDGEEPEEIEVVFVVEDGVVRQRPVRTGLADATRVEILSGLELGQQVVTGPYRELRDLEDGDLVEMRDRDEEEGGEERE